MPLAVDVEISIHALREEGDDAKLDKQQAVTISIHALREEGDKIVWFVLGGVANFYPRPPRGGRPSFVSVPSRFSKNFYPRPPRGGRQWYTHPTKIPQTDFYPRPPRGGRLAEEVGADAGDLISIHALREEGDKSLLLHNAKIRIFLSTPSARRATKEHKTMVGGILVFLSTPSARRATENSTFVYKKTNISIHALREEGDPVIP